MMKREFVWSCIVMTFFVACQQAEVENPKAEDMRMSISASINGQSESPDSRYAGDSPNNVDFVEGDAIGIFIDEKSADEWTLETTGWTSVNNIVYWPSKTKSHTFRAFYPYTEADTYTEVPMPSLLNQNGTIESISECDFLVATKSQSYEESGTVSFEDEESSFKHVSTLLQLTFEQGTALSGAILNKISLEGNNIVSPATYSFTTKGITLAPDGTSDALIVNGLSKELTTGQTFYFIVNEKKDATNPVLLSVEYEIDGKTYEAKMSGFASNVFAGGMCQKYTITIQNDLLVVFGGTISEWGIGESLDDIVINGEEKTES